MKSGQKPDLKEEAKRMRALVTAVDSGDVSKAKELREMIESRDFLRAIGDMHMQVSSHLIGKLAGDKAATVEFICAHLDKRKDDLGYKEANELERMMIDRILMCWLRVVEAENYCTQVSRGGQTFKQCDHAERSLMRANSRFLKACEALSRYRLMTQATRYATSRADLIEARAAKVKGQPRANEEAQQPAPLALVKSGA